MLLMVRIPNSLGPSMRKRWAERESRVRIIARIAAIGAACLALQSCDGGSNYTGTDKIDFANRTVIEPLPTSAVAAAAPAAPGAGGGPLFDRVEEVGVLVDGRLGPSGPHVNDAGFTSMESRLAIPNRVSNFFDIFYPDRRHEVFAFTRDRRLELVATPWTGREDIFKIEFKPRREFPVTIWIVTGPAPTPPSNLSPFDAQRIHALEAVIRTLSIWRAERMGLGFSDVRILNATGNAQAAARANVPGNPTESDTWRPLREQIGFEAGRLNIYWVTTVDGNMTTGWSNFGPQIAMGQNTGDELLSHEIGHALSLTHVNNLPTFDQTNVMHNASSTRQFLTEGQIVRAHMNSTSLLWTLFLDVGQHPPGRDCGPDVTSGACPALNRRIWADGTMPANN